MVSFFTRKMGSNGSYSASVSRQVLAAGCRFMLLFLIVSVCFSGPLARPALATITVDQFVANTMGKELANAAGTYSGECVSLVSQYLLQVHGINNTGWNANAIDYRAGGNGGNRLAGNGFSWSTDQSFANGDILVWGQTGSLGHVGIWYGGKVYDQNDGRHSPARTAGYSTYWSSGFLGHWRKGTVAPPPANIVAPGSSGFSKGGPSTGWHSISSGGNCGQAIYTYVTNAASENWGRWTWDLSQLNGNARYNIQVFIPSTNAGTKNAVYRVNTSAGVQSRSVNQYASSGWVDLGTYSLSAGAAWVELNDNTGEAFGTDENHQIAFDSAKLTYVGPSSFAIASSAGLHGSVSPAGSSSVEYGGSQTFVITPSTGYRISSLIVDGQTVPVATSYTFANVTSAHSIAATFAPIVISTKLTASGPLGVKLGTSYRVYGSITPAAATGKVKVVWARKASNGSYATMKTQYVTLSLGKFACSYRPGSRGTWRARVSYLGGGTAPRYSASSNVYKSFQVK